MRIPAPFVDGLTFPESPRWYDGKLWISDMHGCQLVRCDMDGTKQVLTTFDDNPGGLGFLPDGSPIIVLRYRRQIFRLNADGSQNYDGSQIHADLIGLAAHSLNDMVVDGQGRAYVDCYMMRDHTGASSSDHIYVVEPDGRVHLGVTGVPGPNGLAISPDGRMLVFASTWRRQLMALSIEEDGTLRNPRLFGKTGDSTPDGICMDAEGAVWLGGLENGLFLRILPDGSVAETISVPGKWAVACVLGGPDGRTLFMATSKTTRPVGRNSRGFIETVVVDVPRAGWP